MATGYGTDPTVASSTEAMAYPPPAAAAPVPRSPERSGWVLTSAVILFVVGALSGLFGLIFLLFGVVMGSVFSDLGIQSGFGTGFEMTPSDQAAAEAFSGIFGGLMVGLAVIALLWAGTHIATGVGLLRAREWARIAGLVLAVIGLLFSALGIVGLVAAIAGADAMYTDPAMREFYPDPAAAGDAMRAGVLVNGLIILPFVIGYVIVLVTLIRSGAEFGRRGAM